MELHIISHPTIFPNEHQAIAEVMACSSVIFHLRKPTASDQQYCKLFKSIPKAHHHRIVIHSHHQLSLKHHVYGLHFSTLKRDQAKQYPGAYRSTSCHSTKEIDMLEPLFDACFLSPIFPSISKKGYSGTFTEQELCKHLQTKKVKVIALGGIEWHKIQQLHAWGFDGAAVLGTIWGDDPSYNNDFKPRTDQLLKAIDRLTNQSNE